MYFLLEVITSDFITKCFWGFAEQYLWYSLVKWHNTAFQSRIFYLRAYSLLISKIFFKKSGWFFKPCLLNFTDTYCSLGLTLSCINILLELATQILWQLKFYFSIFLKDAISLLLELFFHMILRFPATQTPAFLVFSFLTLQILWSDISWWHDFTTLLIGLCFYQASFFFFYMVHNNSDLRGYIV